MIRFKAEATFFIRYNSVATLIPFKRDHTKKKKKKPIEKPTCKKIFLEIEACLYTFELYPLYSTFSRILCVLYTIVIYCKQLYFKKYIKFVFIPKYKFFTIY